MSLGRHVKTRSRVSGAQCSSPSPQSRRRKTSAASGGGAASTAASACPQTASSSQLSSAPRARCQQQLTAHSPASTPTATEQTPTPLPNTTTAPWLWCAPASRRAVAAATALRPPSPRAAAAVLCHMLRSSILMHTCRPAPARGPDQRVGARCMPWHSHSVVTMLPHGTRPCRLSNERGAVL